MLAYAETIDDKYNKGVIADSSQAGDGGDNDANGDDDGGQETGSNNSSSGCNALSLNYLLALALCFMLIKFNKRLD